MMGQSVPRPRCTTVDDVLAVLDGGERISMSTLTERLTVAGLPVLGMLLLQRDHRLTWRWRTGEVYSPMHVYEEKFRGPLYVEPTSRGHSE